MIKGNIIQKQDGENGPCRVICNTEEKDHVYYIDDFGRTGYCSISHIKRWGKVVGIFKGTFDELWDNPPIKNVYEDYQKTIISEYKDKIDLYD